MARPNQDDIETLMSITGLPQAVAVQKLEEHGGDLNEAVNAHFSEGDRSIVHQPPLAVSRDDAMDIDDIIPTAQRESSLSLLSAARTMSPFPLLDPNFGRSLFDCDPLFAPRAPFITHPRQVREIPIEVKDSSEPSGRSGNAPTIEDVTETVHEHGSAIHGTFTIDEEDDEDIPGVPTAQPMHARSGGSGLNTSQDYENDIEEEMIQAAIEASKRDAQESRGPSSAQRQFHLEDDEIAQAVTMSLKSAEEEESLREKRGKVQASESGSSKPADPELQKIHAPNERSGAHSSFFQDDDAEDVEEQPLVRQRSRHVASERVESPRDDQPPSHGAENANDGPPNNVNGFPSEWGGISSEEHDEAVMLEAAMFGGIPESGYHFPYATHHHRIPGPPSPSLAAQRLIREQQDDEYLESLQADREKEMKAMREAETRHLEEEAARKAALEEENRKEEEAWKKIEDKQELDRQLAAKEASLPQEPPAHEENAVTLLVRMPDGSRRGRRFFKSDKLQSLFDFIDIGRVVKPGTYRVVRPYPRRAFSDGESALTLNELGLTSKQEALFLELI